MIDTTNITLLVEDRVKEVSKQNPNINELVSNLKSIIMNAVMKKGITVEDCIDVSAKMIVLASLVK